MMFVFPLQRLNVTLFDIRVTPYVIQPCRQLMRQIYRIKLINRSSSIQQNVETRSAFFPFTTHLIRSPQVADSATEGHRASCSCW